MGLSITRVMAFYAAVRKGKQGTRKTYRMHPPGSRIDDNRDDATIQECCYCLSDTKGRVNPHLEADSQIVFDSDENLIHT